MTYTNDYKYITVIWPYTQSQAMLNPSKWHIAAKSTSFQLYLGIISLFSEQVELLLLSYELHLERRF